MSRKRLTGWWYISIGAGFIALGARAAMFGVSGLLVGLRFLIAAGFLILGVLTLRAK